MINNNGIFLDESEKYKLTDTEGWWHNVTAKDLDNDGKIDFILGNHGLNSRYKASKEKPVTMYVNDFDLNGSVEQIICTYNGNTSYPSVMKDDLVKQIPSLETKYRKFADYKDQTMADIFPAEVLKRSVVVNARIMESCIMLNSGNGSFSLTPLPAEAQFGPVYAVMADDFDKDGITDILLGGNQYRAKPEGGIYDASYGLLLKGTGNNKFVPVSPLASGIFTKGEIRDIKIFATIENRVIAVARNNDKLEFYKF
jgi:enediyne biosynthesis protein E4